MGELLWGTHLSQEVAVSVEHTERETECPGELSEEQTTISLLWEQGLGVLISALILGRDGSNSQSCQRTKAQKPGFH